MSENEKEPLFNSEEQEEQQERLSGARSKSEPKTIRQRMTKSEVKQYADWYFSDSVKDEIPNWNNKKIITEYEKVSGRKLSHQFIAAQKKRWVLVNGEVVRNSA